METCKINLNGACEGILEAAIKDGSILGPPDAEGWVEADLSKMRTEHKRFVAFNKATPQEVLSMLAENENKLVREMANKTMSMLAMA